MSNKDCRSDCTVPAAFPRPIGNRAGLPRIDYRLGTYSEIREAMLRALDDAEPLRGWTYRGSDDPGIALLEGAAVLGDILTFYQNLYANEAYIRTAAWRESIADLVRLLGYRLSPGLGGHATFTFEVKGDAPVEIPAGFPLKAQLESLPRPSEFRTSEPLTAYPWLNRFSLYRPLIGPPDGSQITELSIESPDQQIDPIPLKKGDRILVGRADNPAAPSRFSGAETAIVDSVREEHGVRIVRIKGSLKQTSAPGALAAYKLGRTFRHFGHLSAPKIPGVVSTTTTSSSDGKTVTTNILLPSATATSFTRDLASATVSGTTPVIPASLAATEFPLDGDVPDLATGTDLLIEARITSGSSAPVDMVYVRKVASTRSDALAWGTLNGRGTILAINSMLEAAGSSGTNTFDIRQIQLHETTGPRMELRPWRRETTAASGDVLYFLGTGAQAGSLMGRRLMLDRAGSPPLIVTVRDVETLSPATAARTMLRKITLGTPVNYADFPNISPAVTVYGNIVQATEGKSEPEIPIGNGDSRQIFQTFKLPKKPLTYHLSAGETPPETPELSIRVNGKLWQRVPTLFGRRYDEEIYIVREDADNVSWVQFGDGKTGARLPSGVGNVMAGYRTGTGAFGRLKPDTTVQPGARVERLEKVRMPAPATGGSEPEDGGNARDAAPGKFQSLDRLVSLQDFESETLAIAGVARASAAWRIHDGSPAIVLTVLMEMGRGSEIADVRGVIEGYNRCRGPRRHRVVVNPGALRFVGITLEVASDPRLRREDVEARIMAALGIVSGTSDRSRSEGMFSMRARRFGEAEYARSVEGRGQRVEGVLWARVIGFASLGTADDPATIATVSAALPFTASVPAGPDEILALYAGHLTIIHATNPAGEEC